MNPEENNATQQEQPNLDLGFLLNPGQSQAETTPAQTPGEEVLAEGEETAPETSPAQVPAQPNPYELAFNALKQALPQAVAPAQGQGQKEQENPGPFNFTGYESLGPKLTGALLSDDPAQRQAGYAAFASTITANILNQVQEAIDKYYAPQVQSMIQQSHQERATQNSISNDFYSDNKHLDTPENREVVLFAAQRVLTEMQQKGQKITGWTPEIKAAIINRVYALAPALRPVQNGGSKQPFKATGGVRSDSGNTAGLTPEQKQMLEFFR